MSLDYADGCRLDRQGGALTGSSILIVDDHDVFRSTLREWLAFTLPGVVIFEAASGEECIAAASANCPDIILMDIGLPGITGIEATRQVMRALPQTRVVILSINETASQRAAAAAAGAVGYVAKSDMVLTLRPVLSWLLAGQAKEQPGVGDAPR
jgi:two-component system invasion response regulator UvrY